VHYVAKDKMSGAQSFWTSWSWSHCFHTSAEYCCCH